MAVKGFNDFRTVRPPGRKCQIPNSLLVFVLAVCKSQPSPESQETFDRSEVIWQGFNFVVLFWAQVKE